MKIISLKSKRIILISIFIIITTLYILFVINHFKNKEREIEKPSVSFDVEALKNDLKDENKIIDVSFLYDCKEKARFLLLNGYTREGFEIIGYLHNILRNKSAEVQAWYYSGMLMMADVEEKSLRKLNFVENAVKGIKETYNLYENNFEVCCILSQSLLSLPDFFPDEIDYGIKILYQTIDKIKEGKYFVIEDKSFNLIKCDNFDYLKVLVNKTKESKRYKEYIVKQPLFLEGIL